MKGNPMVVLPYDRERHEGRLFHAIVIELRWWDMWPIIPVLFMRYYIYCKSSRPDIVFAIICYLSIVITSLRFSHSLPYFTFYMCWIHWYERFASFRGESLASLINNLLKISYCTFFFVWVFSSGFSYKVFNEAISTQDYVISSIFPEGVFGGWYWDIRYIVLFFMWVFSFEVSHIKFLIM